VPEYAASEGAAAHEPEVEVMAEAPEALEAVEAPDVVGLPWAVAPAADVPSAADADLGLEALAAAGESADAVLETFVAVVAAPANTGPEAFAAIEAESAGAGLAGFAAAGLAACAEVAPATGGIPNPAGDLCESVAVGDLAAAAGVGV
jgi:hypothetical protein